MGSSDGERLDVDALFALLRAIVDAVEVPVTADLERGYGLAPRELVERMRDAGVVGCNLEDSDPRTEVLVAAEEQAELLAAVREEAQALQWDIVINARIDAVMNGDGSPEERLKECLARAQHYGEADCVYPIMLEGSGLAAFVREVDLPVNALCRRGSGLPAKLAADDVARVSFGPGLYRAQDPAAMLAAIRAGADPWPAS
jgi:2-methylisocitrate lyase-like PEP mutase family enzyme